MKEQAVIILAGDATGNLVGTVSKNDGTEALVGQAVEIKGKTPTGEWTRETTTGEHGFFVVDLPAYPTGSIEVTAGEAKTTVKARNLSLRLTPRSTDPKNRLSLCGAWEYKADPKEKDSEWVNTTVPGHPEMEGHYAKTDTGLLRRTINVPKEWKGKRVRLRAEAIYSFSEVSVNGKHVGQHDGGATPFELDVTEALNVGEENEIEVAIIGRSKAAEIDNMSMYACIEIAGIWRPIELFCIEPVHVARVTYQTIFDKNYKDATLDVQVRVANEQDKSRKALLGVKVIDPDGKELKLKDLGAEIELEPWETRLVSLSVKVDRPEQWSAELPNLYTLKCELESKGQPVQAVEQPLGFRQIDIKGRGFQINGKPVKLFGACLHASDPFLGRAIGTDLVEQDLELMKGANLNAIRTSHYPPHPHTPEYADKIGLYIEDEGPSCWAGNFNNLQYIPLYVGILSEMVERDRNHPSVVYWSTCNESDFGLIFQVAHKHIKSLDTTRPGSGSYAPLDSDTDAYVIHHPTNLHEHIETTKDHPKPVFYDECLTVFHGWGDFAHTLEIDPGMHDYWETRMLEIRRQEMSHENQMGTMIWAWIDDAFLSPGRGEGIWRRTLPQIRYTDSVYRMPKRGYVGDCVWGMIDAWRRPRPVWWHSKKVYSPLLIPEKPLELPKPGKPIVIPVENLNWFANLSVYDCHWEIAGRRGVVKASVPASTMGSFEIMPPIELTGDESVLLEWLDTSGRLVDTYRLRFHSAALPSWKLGKPAEVIEETNRYLHEAKVVYLRGKDSELAYEKASGVLMWGLKANEQILLQGPHLHIQRSDSPTTDDPGEWKFEEETHEPGRIVWKGHFGESFEGQYDIRMDRNGAIEITYEFAYSGKDQYCREIGLEFDLPTSFDLLSWERLSSHSVYPDDHIGRPIGKAMAHPNVAQTTPPGDRPFGLDDHPWGCNDFRSCKRNIVLASLTNAEGQGLEVVSDGTQTVRVTMGEFKTSLKVLDYYGGSGGHDQWSVLGFHYGAGKMLKDGDVVKGKVRVRLV